MVKQAENYDTHEKKVEKLQETPAKTKSLDLADVGKVDTPANIFAHLKSGDKDSSGAKNAFRSSEQGKSDSKGKELVKDAIKHHSQSTQAKHINELQQHYKSKLEPGSHVIGYGQYTGSDGGKHDALLIKGTDGKQHSVDPESGKIVDKSLRAQDSSTKSGKGSHTSDQTLTDPNHNPIDMAHPCQVDVGGGQQRMYGVAGSPDAPGMKKDGNMIESVKLDASGKPTGQPEQVHIDGLHKVLAKYPGKPGASNPAVFKMPDGKVGMVFEVDKKNGKTVERSDFYMAVSSDGGKTFKMSNGSEPVMRGSGKDPFISVPRVEKNKDGSYSMYFCKAGQHDNTLAMATSHDGQHWDTPKDIKVNKLPHGAAIMDPDVQTYTAADGSTHYRMLFTTNNSESSYNTNSPTTIWMADSTDGIRFNNPKQVVQPTGHAFKVMDPQFVKVKGKSYVQYVQVEHGQGDEQKMQVMRRPFES